MYRIINAINNIWFNVLVVKGNFKRWCGYILWHYTTEKPFSNGCIHIYDQKETGQNYR